MSRREQLNKAMTQSSNIDPQYSDCAATTAVPLSRIHGADMFAAELAAYLSDRASRRMFEIAALTPAFEAARADYCTALRAMWAPICAYAALREEA